MSYMKRGASHFQSLAIIANEQIATLRAALEAVEWEGRRPIVPPATRAVACDLVCPACGCMRSDGHAPDCIVGRALLRKECK